MKMKKWFYITFILATIFGFAYEIHNSTWFLTLGGVFLGQASVLFLLLMNDKYRNSN